MCISRTAVIAGGGPGFGESIACNFTTEGYKFHCRQICSQLNGDRHGPAVRSGVSTSHKSLSTGKSILPKRGINPRNGPRKRIWTLTLWSKHIGLSSNKILPPHSRSKFTLRTALNIQNLSNSYLQSSFRTICTITLSLVKLNCTPDGPLYRFPITSQVLMSQQSTAHSQSHGIDVANLAPSSTLVVKVLEYEGECTQSELAAKTWLPPRTLRFGVKQLEKKDIVSSRISLRDARKNVYTLETSLERLETQ